MKLIKRMMRKPRLKVVGDSRKGLGYGLDVMEGKVYVSIDGYEIHFDSSEDIESLIKNINDMQITYSARLR